MRRIYHPYYKWEDVSAGMFENPSDMLLEQSASAELLKNTQGLKDAMTDVTLSWPLASEHNLSNLESNRRAWLGQAACCFAVGSTAYATKSAWWILTTQERDNANDIADMVILKWEEEFNGIEALFNI
jgi:hypothetical protein